MYIFVFSMLKGKQILILIDCSHSRIIWFDLHKHVRYTSGFSMMDDNSKLDKNSKHKCL